MKIYIYTLTDPNTNMIRYIGKSNNPDKRLRIHLIEARRGLKSYRSNWLRKLITMGQKPNKKLSIDHREKIGLSVKLYNQGIYGEGGAFL